VTHAKRRGNQAGTWGKAKVESKKRAEQKSRNIEGDKCGRLWGTRELSPPKPIKGHLLNFEQFWLENPREMVCIK